MGLIDLEPATPIGMNRIPVLIVSLSLCAATEYAEPPPNNVTKSEPIVETSIVSKAMALIRQHKFGGARELLLTAAERGDAESQALLGQIYNAGWGVPVDYVQAFKWWSRAAEGGSTDAQWGLGLLYDEGKGVARDSKKAAVLWTQASQRDNIKATVNLAFLYEEGRGVERDLKECARLFKVAAEAGEPAAQFNYGLKVLHGEGVEQNEVLGCAWLAVAAESPRVKGTQYAERLNLQRDRAWADLSAGNREKAGQVRREIQTRIKVD